MPDKEYDNSNQGGLWAETRKVASGTIDIHGCKYYCDLIQTGRDKPSHRMYCVACDDRDVMYGCAIFRDERDNKRLLNGEIKVGERSHWVSVFVVDKSDNPKKPDLRITFQPKDEAAPTHDTAAPICDEIPF